MVTAIDEGIGGKRSERNPGDRMRRERTEKSVGATPRRDFHARKYAYRSVKRRLKSNNGNRQDERLTTQKEPLRRGLVQDLSNSICLHNSMPLLKAVKYTRSTLLLKISGLNYRGKKVSIVVGNSGVKSMIYDRLIGW